LSVCSTPVPEQHCVRSFVVVLLVVVVVEHYCFSECEHFEVDWDFGKMFELFEPLEQPSSLNEGGKTNGSTGACTERSGSSVVACSGRVEGNDLAELSMDHAEEVDDLGAL
jgi:hypothetical protein